MMHNEPASILYADDDEDNRVMVITLLGLSNIKVSCGRTVAESLLLARREPFDLYLLDSRFPDGNGVELCRQLRIHTPRTPILFYSGDARESSRQTALLAGATAYLTKPFFGDLGETILQTIHRSKTTVAE